METGLKRDIDGMGAAEIKYGDSVSFLMHVTTGLWLSYQAPDAKSSRLGPIKRRVRTYSGLHVEKKEKPCTLPYKFMKSGTEFDPTSMSYITWV